MAIKYVLYKKPKTIIIMLQTAKDKKYSRQLKYKIRVTNVLNENRFISMDIRKKSLINYQDFLKYRMLGYKIRDYSKL